MKKQKNKKEILVALDRDGTLIHDDGYFGKSENWKKELTIYDGAIEMVKEINKFSKVVVATNQIGIIYGFFNTQRVEDINNHIDGIFKKNGAKIDGWYYSPYVERNWAKKNNLDLKSPWVLKTFPKTRKPNTGMLEVAAMDFEKTLEDFQIFVIGDSLDDMGLAENAKGTGIFFRNGKNEEVFEKIKHKKNIHPIKNLSEVKNVLKELL